MLGTTYKKHLEENKSAHIYHIQTKSDEIICTPNQGKKKFIYILGIFNFAGYKPYNLNVLVDTGATVCSARWKQREWVEKNFQNFV